MPNPVVIAHHLVWTAYGSWLENDPCGSGSHDIGSEAIAELGDLHHGQKKLQPAGLGNPRRLSKGALRLAVPPADLQRSRLTRTSPIRTQ